MDRERLIRIATGEEPADLLIKNARIVNVFTGEIDEADVAVGEGHIAGVGGYNDAISTIELKGKYLAPAYMDAHIHIESSMLMPAEFAKAVLPHGTTATVSDPHEIANVLGMAGIELMLNLSEGMPFDFFFTLSSCVPATHMETSGAELTADELFQLAEHPRVVALAEMMNFPGVIRRAREVMKKIELAHSRGMIIDGHSPLVRGNDLNAYLCGGIRSDHECTHLDEANEKLRKGMWVFIREGTTEKNLLELLRIVNDFTVSRLCLVSDDKHPNDLLEDGHLNSTVYLAVKNGVSPASALRMASLNPAIYYNLPFRGAIAPAYRADFQFLENLDRGLLKPLAVFKAGKLVAEDGRLVTDFTTPEVPEWATNTVKAIKAISPDRLRVPRSGKNMRVIRVIPGQIVTGSEKISVHGQYVEPDIENDILKLVVAERYTGEGNLSIAFVKGFGLKAGAIASSVAHDSHNLIAVGVSDEDIAHALNELIRVQGGLVAVKNRTTIGVLPLPLAGLMTLEPAIDTSRKLIKLLEALRDKLGSSLENPFMALSFLALPVIPELKLTDKGLVDAKEFRFTPMFLD